MGIFKKLFGKGSSADRPPPRPSASYRQSKVEANNQGAKSEIDAIDLDPHLHGKIESIGPGKNVFVRSQYVREDTGTHETLKIIDESLLQPENEDGFDPYNTGRFDRSKHWNTRTRK
jgi:hypothetical protein